MDLSKSDIKSSFERKILVAALSNVLRTTKISEIIDPYGNAIERFIAIERFVAVERFVAIKRFVAVELRMLS
jgi:hypothetical protein